MYFKQTTEDSFFTIYAYSGEALFKEFQNRDNIISKTTYGHEIYISDRIDKELIIKESKYIEPGKTHALNLGMVGYQPMEVLFEKILEESIPYKGNFYIFREDDEFSLSNKEYRELMAIKVNSSKEARAIGFELSRDNMTPYSIMIDDKLIGSFAFYEDGDITTFKKHSKRRAYLPYYKYTLVSSIYTKDLQSNLKWCIIDL